MTRKNLKGSVFLLVFLLSACAVPAPQEPGPEEAMKILPGAVVSDDGRRIAYPGESLFGTGAVLPLPGGMEVLDPLIDLLLAHPGLKGSGTVRSDGHDDEYDRRLAMKRKELLTAVFRNRGLPAERLAIAAEVGPGAPFEVTFQSAVPLGPEDGNR